MTVPVGEVMATSRVGLGIDDAFRVLTDDIDRWWRRESTATDAIVQFQGDRLVSIGPNGVEVLALISTWSPPSLVELQWFGPHAKQGDTVTIELTPDRDGTRVTVRHLQEGLPPGGAGTGFPGLWWADLLRRLTSSHPSHGTLL